jgi:soluble lytic murein transglycosylase-like protein/TolA-binding protein
MSLRLSPSLAEIVRRVYPFTGAASAALLMSVLAACDGGSPLPAQNTRTATARGAAQIAPLVQRADSLERAERWRDAADAWHDASRAAPVLRHWFVLKAASAHPEATVRTRWLTAVPLPPTADTVAWRRRFAGAHLRALLRHGDTTSAVRQYLQLGNVRDSVVALSLRVWQGDPLNDTDRLALARGALRIGDTPLARREYAALVLDGSRGLTPADRYDYAVLLFNARAYEQALRAFDAVDGNHEGRAAYQRARTLLRLGRASSAAAALRTVTTRYASDTAAAGLAWYLLGDLAADAGRDADAGEAWRMLAERYPTHSHAPRAAFRAAMLQVAAEQWSAAMRLLAPLTTRSNEEQLAARYWTGRALASQGQPRRADSTWRTLLTDAPDSYYALLAAKRLKTAPWTPMAAGDEPRPRAVDAAGGEVPLLDERDVTSTLQRIALLDSLKLADEARDERNDLVKAASGTASDARRVAGALLQDNLASPAITIAGRVPEIAKSRAREDQRLRFPLPFREKLTESAAAERLDLPFVAALIRQESRFTPTARSSADARGLMQVMPSVGRSIAASLGIRPWHDSLLYVPAINLRIGSRHLAADLRRDGAAHPAYALAAYNAGRSRLVRWRAKRGAARDWELFVERIPYVETRDYVRIVLRNEEWYRALYDE